MGTDPDDGFLAGLRRRKVVQWGIAYVAGAWGLLQGFAYLSSVFGWPPTLQRPVTTALLIGLPIAPMSDSRRSASSTTCE